MRTGNLLLVVVCSAGTCAAAVMAWRWRDLPVAATRDPVDSAGASALDALRTLACVVAAGFVSGVLVVGLGGRLVMRVLAATSGAGAQGATTDAGEAVGEISLGGSISFMIFAGILVPVAVALPFVAFRWFLPNISWVAGLAYGVILLGVLGVDDPLAPDNRDFFILSPTWLAVALVSATALLFGMTFAALSAKLDAALSSGSRPGSKGSWRQKSAYASLIFLVNPFLAPIAAVYVAGRAVSRGRLGRLLEVAPLRLAGRVIVAVLTITALAMVVGAAADIL